MYYENRCIYCALGRIVRRSNVSCPRAALARALCRCPPRRRPPTLRKRRTSHLASFVRALRASARKPRARSESTRASSQRVHRVRRVSTDPKAADPWARVEIFVAKSLLLSILCTHHFVKWIPDGLRTFRFVDLYLKNLFERLPPSSILSLSPVRTCVPTTYFYISGGTTCYYKNM
jgi:hypothetical protein